MKRLRVACATPSVSHFEVPLLRLCAQMDDLCFEVFHRQVMPARQRYDSEFQGVIDWGEDLAQGYASTHCGSARDLVRNVRAFRPDVVLVYGYTWPGCARLMLSCRTRGVAMVHRGPMTCLRDPRAGRMARLRRPLRQVFLRQFRGHHYSGGHSLRVLEGAGIGPERRFFVPYSVDAPHFARRAEEECGGGLRAEIGFADDARVVLFLGQHNWIKGPDIALDAIRRAQDADPAIHALIVGTGRETDAMRQQAERSLRPGSFHFAGFVPSKETVSFYLASDVAIFPSRYETWARAVNEAMLCGCPTITSRRVGASDGLVRDGVNGLVVEAPEADSFAEAIGAFFALPVEERREWQRAAREDALALSYERHQAALRASFYDSAGWPQPAAQGSEA